MTHNTFSFMETMAVFGAANQTGTSGDDILTGGPDDDVLDGKAGNDQLFGGDGDDQLFGGDGDDFLVGGSGDDYLNPGDNVNGFDGIATGIGDDIVDLSDQTPGASEVGLFHDQIYGHDQGIAVAIDGVANTGSIDKGGTNGTTTILEVNTGLRENPGVYGGMLISGTQWADSFHINPGDNGWLVIRGGGGTDSYVIDASAGFLRLDFANGVQGLRADLRTGIIANDGHGNRETITGTGGVSEIRGNDQNDIIKGSGRDESFILRGGVDVLDGRGGTDLVRYDRASVDAVSVDLQAGSATGIWQGQAFNHSLDNIEDVRGSRFADDRISGTNGANTLSGRGGDDTLKGRGGKDVLNGDDGNDKLVGGAGDDILIGDGPGWYFYDPDTVNSGHDTLLGGRGNDILKGGLDGDILEGGLGRDILKGGAGNDAMNGGAGNDKMTGGKGADRFIFSAGNDRITDFNAANNREKIDLSNVASIRHFNDLRNNHTSQDGSDLVITDDSGNSLTLTGLEIGDLDRGDFVF